MPSGWKSTAEAVTVFDFGQNWEEYSEHRVNAETLALAVKSLRTLLQTDNLNGKSFLDIGCGSGLFSIAASQMGASSVVGVDINPRCLLVSEKNRARLIPEKPIRFATASALDPNQLEALGQFDVVYAWGSLHHTGKMWDAIRLVSKCVAADGTFVLAIYNAHITSPIWRLIKRTYAQMPAWGKRLLVYPFAGIIYIAKFLVTQHNPLDKERGMDFWYDVVDWIGGYPYEYATPDQVEEFMSNLGFVRRNFVPAQVPTGCNEFVLEKVAG